MPGCLGMVSKVYVSTLVRSNSSPSKAVELPRFWRRQARVAINPFSDNVDIGEECSPGRLAGQKTTYSREVLENSSW